MIRHLCPRPVAGGGVCLVPLPCAEHEIETSFEGYFLYGSIYSQAVPDPAVAAPRRRRRLLLGALSVLSAVLVVSSMGDASFTGKALLTIAAVAATTAVLLIDLTHNRNGATS